MERESPLRTVVLPHRRGRYLRWIAAGAGLAMLAVAVNALIPIIESHPAAAEAARAEARIAGPDDTGAIGEALAAWARVSDLDPSNAHAHFRRAVMLYYLGRYDESVAAADLASRADPQAAWPWEVKAQALIRKGLYLEALEALQKALDLGDDEARLWWLVAKCNAGLDRPPDMLAALARAIEKAPQIAAPLDDPEAEPFRRFRHDPGFQSVYKARPEAAKGPGDARLYGFL